MRQHLIQTFDELYLLDLHGNSKKKETTPEGGKDENVFDIQQGVSILLAIKNQTAQKQVTSPTIHSINHANIWGLREDKYKELSHKMFSKILWEKITPVKPFDLFVPRDNQLLPEYEEGWRTENIFPINSTGIKTHRDHFAYDFEFKNLENRINDFLDLKTDDKKVQEKYDLTDTRDWKLNNKRRMLKDVIGWNKLITKCTYRPFDDRFLVYTPLIVELPKVEVFNNLINQENLALFFMRQVAVDDSYSHFFVSSCPVDNRGFFSDKGTVNAAPLYIYPNKEKQQSLFGITESQRVPNLADEFIKDFARKIKLEFIPDGQGDLKKTYGPEDVFYYAYAVFHSPTYRSRYAEFLKIDFPRLPLTSDKKLFAALVAKGKELVELHLLKSAKVEDFVTTYPVAGENRVEKVSFLVEDHISRRGAEIAEKTKPIIQPIRVGKVWINATQYFGDVPEAVWNFKIGGYQVCDKWLKDRKGRVLSGEEISHYQRVVVSLKETMRLMKEIDQVIPRWPME